MKKSSFAIVGHSVYPARAGDIRRYLLENKCRELWYITHDFSTRRTRKSYIEHYRAGRLSGKRDSLDYRFLAEPLVNIKDFLYTMSWLLFRVKRADLYIGLSGADTACGVIMKKLGRIRRVVYYSIDFIPVRFKNPLLNSLYHRINDFALRGSSEIWDLSPRMSEGRQRVRGLDVGDLPHQRVVPAGIWPDARRCPFEEVNKSELVFIGELSEKTGVGLVIEAVPAILEEVPSFVFRVIGTGAFEGELKALAKRLAVDSRVLFDGLVLDEDTVSDRLAHAALAVAMYQKEKDDFTYYADPAKIKTYLSAGLPVLMTDLPYNARELEQNGCGLIVKYDKESVAGAVITLMKDEGLLQDYRANVSAYSRRLDWNRLLEESFGRIL